MRSFRKRRARIWRDLRKEGLSSASFGFRIRFKAECAVFERGKRSLPLGRAEKGVYHNTPVRVLQGTKTLVLVPGSNNAFGYGVYGGWDHPEPMYGSTTIYIRNGRKFFVRVKDNYARTRGTALLLRLERIEGNSITAVVIREFRSGALKTKSDKFLKSRPRRLVRRLKSAKPTLLSRIVGKLLAIYLLTKKSQKHKALGWFLLGLGRDRKIPQDVLDREVPKSRILVKEDNRVLMRPYENSELFWLVGSFWLVRKNDGWVVDDVYDFHPQQGQRVGIDQGWCWAYSELTGKEKELALLVRRYLPRKVRYLISKQGHVSNDMWNYLGGKPYRWIGMVKDWRS